MRRETFGAAPEVSDTPRVDASEPILGRYRLERRLAVGGMGEVHLAWDAKDERPVILKALRRHLMGEQRLVLQFLDEARISAQLHHPNVVEVFEVGEWKGEFLLAMEFIPGHDLVDIHTECELRQVGAVPVGVAAQVILDAAVGLHYVHGATDLQGKPLKVIHRDVSPHNLMVREDGLTKLLDFGVARAEARLVRTMGGALKGKLAYMAPEQIRGLEPTPAVDQFALGIVAWELFTLRRLFSSDSEGMILDAVLNRPIPPVSELGPHVPEAVSQVVARMLQRERIDRYGSCAEVADALRPFAGGRDAVVAFRRSLGLAAPVVRSRGALKTLIAQSPDEAPPPAASPGGRAPTWPSVVAVKSGSKEVIPRARPSAPAAGAVSAADAAQTARTVLEVRQADAPQPEAAPPPGPGGTFILPPEPPPAAQGATFLLPPTRAEPPAPSRLAPWKVVVLGITALAVGSLGAVLVLRLLGR